MLFGVRWGSLRAKILAWAFVPAAIILTVVAVVTFVAYQRVTADLVMERNSDLIRLSASQLVSELAEHAQQLQAEARLPVMYSSDLEDQRAVLRTAANRLSLFDGGVILLDPYGMVLAAQPERREILGEDWADRSYYRGILQAEVLGSLSPAYSDIVSDGVDGRDVIALAVPVKGPRGEFGGVLVGMFEISSSSATALYGDIAKLRIGDRDIVYLVDGAGRLVYHSDASRIGQDVSGHPAVRLVLDDQTSSIRTHNLESEETVASFAPVPGTNWGLVTEENWQTLLRAGQPYRQFLLVLLALGVLVPAIVVSVGVRRLTTPISDLIEGAREIAGGNFGRTVSADTGDEIEELAAQFNRMAAKLQASYASLEDRVTSRTNELAALNAIASVVNQSLDLDEILAGALETTLEVMGVEAGGIYLLDRSNSLLTIAAQRGLAADLIADIDHLRVGEGFSGRVVESGKPLVVRDVSSDPRLSRDVVRDAGLQSVAIVPLSCKQKVLGTLFTISFNPRDFLPQEIEVLTSIGHQIGIAIDNVHLVQAERRRAEQFRVISEAGQRMTSILDSEQLLEEIVHLIRETFGYYLVDIALIEGGHLDIKAGAGYLFDRPGFQPPTLLVNGKGIMPCVARTGKPLNVPDVSQEPRYLSVPGGLETRSELAVPLRTKTAIIGVLDVQSDRLDAFDDSDLAVLQSLADQAATAIENAWLFKAEQRRAEQFRVISEVGRQITAILTEDQLLAQMATSIQEAFNYFHVGIGLVEGEYVVSRAEVGGSAKASKDLRLQVGRQGVWGWVAQSGQPRLTPDVSQDPYWSQTPGAPTIHSQVCVPLKTKEAVIGVLSAESDRLDAFDDSDLVILQALAHQAAFAIENARFFRDTTRQVRDLRALADASRIITSVLDQDQLLLALYRQIRRIAPTDYYLIALYDSSSGLLRIEVNVDDGVHLPKQKSSLADGLLTKIILERRPLRLPSLVEAQSGTKLIDIPRDSDRPLHGWLGVPMLYGEKVVGAIAVGSYQHGTFDEWHEQALSSIANQAAVAVENARLYGQAQQLAVMEERQRLARELHDAVTQTLFSASLISEALPEVWEVEPEEGRQLLADLQQLSRGALAEMRTLLLELRPAALIDASLDDLLRQLGEAVAGRTGASVQVTLKGKTALPLDVHVALYRIAQEALNNVTKHSSANQVEVLLQQTRSLASGPNRRRVELRVRDNGQGFSVKNVPPDRFGLGIIRERAEDIGADLSITSSPGKGTEVAVLWQEFGRRKEAS
jgi:GAF domain-containing protein/HAMP domain-containing protein